MTTHAFPDGFLWGVATSAPQIEGGRRRGRARRVDLGPLRRDARADRGRLGRRASPATTTTAGAEDVELMRWLGLGAYRFSIAWPRVAARRDAARSNAAGLDFYDALVDGLLDVGIQPFVTLYHWDLPQALQDRGGWAARETAEAFVGVRRRSSPRRLGDRVAPLGHPQRAVVHRHPGPRGGPPRARSPRPAEALRVAHHLLLSHGWAAEAIRGRTRREPRSASCSTLTPAYPASASDADRDAARWFDGFFNRWYLDPLFRGGYPDDAIADRVAPGHLAGPELPFVQDGDLADHRGAARLPGRQLLQPRGHARPAPTGDPVAVQMVPEDGPHRHGLGGLPAGAARTPGAGPSRVRPGEIYVTENGAAYADLVDATAASPTRPHRVPARSPAGGPPCHRRRRAARRLLRLVPARQLRVGARLHQALRPLLGRLRDAATHPQGQRVLVP